jgi:hypothetical protein
VTVPLWAPFAFLAGVCWRLPEAAVGAARQLARRLRVRFHARRVAGCRPDRLVAGVVDDCGCRKGAIRPCCPRHDPAQRTAAKRPWWWFLAAPYYVVAGLWGFLHGWKGDA